MSVKQAHSLVTGSTTDFPLQQHSLYHSACMTQSWQRTYVLSSGLIPKWKEAKLCMLNSSLQTDQSGKFTLFLLGKCEGVNQERLESVTLWLLSIHVETCIQAKRDSFFNIIFLFCIVFSSLFPFHFLTSWKCQVCL